MVIYLGWRSLKGNSEEPWIRNIALAFASTKGTCFYKANLTNADFTKAKLKNTDFRQATLIYTYWNQAKKLDLSRLGSTYLQNKELRKLVLTGDGKDKNFERQDLRALNLHKGLIRKC